MNRGVLAALLAIMALSSADARALDVAQERLTEIRKCEAIDPSASQSGLVFNPDGYRSFYVRSQCFQEAAVRFRDQRLCDQVRRRWSLLSSSWGYTPSRCRQLVAEGVAADRRELEERKRAYARAAIRLSDFRVERNGNGRDIDIIPSFTGTHAGSYLLTFDILQSGATGPTTQIHSSGYYIDENSNLRIYIPAADIRRRLPGFVVDRVYDVRATLTLDVGMGSQSGYWSDEFIAGVFPVRDRSHAIIRRAAF